jgi:hypothetical protein
VQVANAVPDYYLDETSCVLIRVWTLFSWFSTYMLSAKPMLIKTQPKCHPGALSHSDIFSLEKNRLSATVERMVARFFLAHHTKTGKIYYINEHCLYQMVFLHNGHKIYHHFQF